MFWIIIVAIILLGIYFFYQNRFINVTAYKLTVANLPTDLRGKKIVHISDLNFRANMNNGFVNTILSKIEKQEPDMIVVTGNTIYSTVEYLEETPVKEFFESLCQKAPTYVVTGNHDIENIGFDELGQLLVESGAHLLIDDAVYATFKNEQPHDGLVLMGFAERGDMNNIADPYLKNIELDAEMIDKPKILLAHHPEYFDKYLEDTAKAPDLTFSGHTLGGQIVLPYFGGLITTTQGLLPAYDYGLFVADDQPTKRMIVTRGMGNASIPVRLNNRIEIVTVILN
ncbi:metallophosphoesterase [Dolosigranulum pigrum]|uniref:Calcineurin-like phosphoesterase domain-containing protein n=1 Tax=Dolosigranulum pigrum TaxID=29394 RepID=A0A516GIX2_9LACT|nr:metallophosphoesterase [Dolosigranulum pigrum]QDO91464.1 hypothetical protein FNV33_05095 [Dolosigranulum pigrum]